MFSYTDCIPQVFLQLVVVCMVNIANFFDKILCYCLIFQILFQLIELVFRSPPGPVNIEIAALCINLATKQRNAQVLRFLIKIRAWRVRIINSLYCGLKLTGAFHDISLFYSAGSIQPDVLVFLWLAKWAVLFDLQIVSEAIGIC